MKKKKVILELGIEIWYCYDYEGGSTDNPLFTSISYEMADSEAKDSGYEVVRIIDLELED